MKVTVTRIKNTFLRRSAMLCLAPFLVALAVPLAVLRGVIELHELWATLGRSWVPAWQGVAPGLPRVELEATGRAIHITIPNDLLAFAAEHAPFVHSISVDDPAEYGASRFRILDTRVFASSIAQSICRPQGEDDNSLLHDMVDDAIEAAVEDGSAAGYIWPSMGVGAKCVCGTHEYCPDIRCCTSPEASVYRCSRTLAGDES